VERGEDGDQKFYQAASEPLAILKFNSAMNRSSVSNSGAEVRAVLLLSTVMLPRRGQILVSALPPKAAL